jgi:hypothetical protein
MIDIPKVIHDEDTIATFSKPVLIDPDIRNAVVDQITATVAALTSLIATTGTITTLTSTTANLTTAKVTNLQLGGVAVTATAANLNDLAGNILNGNSLGKCFTKEVDCSEGGVATSTAIMTLPAGSVIMEIGVLCTESMNGDTTKTFEVGIAGNTNKYIDPVDCPVTLNGVMTMQAGTNNDQKLPEFLSAETSIVATWTNTAEASEGKFTVRVMYF